MRGNSPEKDRSERYLLTYSDLMNLLLILFIVLYSMSKTDVKKTQAVAAAIRAGFNGNPLTTSSATVVGNAKSGSSKADPDLSYFYDQLVALINKNGLSNKVDITSDGGNEVVISLQDNVLFASGKADLSADSTNLMATIGGLIAKVPYGQILVEGHTDSDPIHTAQFEDNLALSSTRADNVERVLLSSGIDAKKIVALGYGETWPVAPNDTAANKAKNRRVVLTILRRSVSPPADKVVGSQSLVQTLQDVNGENTSASTSSSSKTASSKTSSSSKLSSSSSSKASSKK